jgi:hypothetical protein
MELGYVPSWTPEMKQSDRVRQLISLMSMTEARLRKVRLYKKSHDLKRQRWNLNAVAVQEGVI